MKLTVHICVIFQMMALLGCSSNECYVMSENEITEAAKQHIALQLEHQPDKWKIITMSDVDSYDVDVEVRNGVGHVIYFKHEGSVIIGAIITPDCYIDFTAVPYLSVP